MKIFSVHSNRTDFLSLQYESLKRFCKDSFEYYCIDNFVRSEDQELIKKQCKDFDIHYVKFDTYSLTGSAWDHAPALNSIKNITNDSEINVILDFDIFLINEFSFVNYIQEYNIAGMYQQRNNFDIEYLSPFVVIVNKNSDFSQLTFDGVNGCDVGGNTRNYLKSHIVKLILHTSALHKKRDEKCFTIPYDSSYGCQILEGSFLHYYRGTNWDQKSEDFKIKKTSWLKNALEVSKTQNILNSDYLSIYQTQYSHAFEFWNGSNGPFKSILNPYAH